MNHRLPDLRLLRAFGNESVFLEKVGGGGALAARFAVGLMEANRSLDARRREEELEAQAARMNLAFRMLEDRLMRPVRENARHTRMPMILMALQARGGRDGLGVGAPLQGMPRALTGEDVPLGMDEGMVRMASAIGQDLAAFAMDKEAGIGQAIGSFMQGLSRGGAPKIPKVPGASPAAGGFLQAAKNKLQGAVQGIRGLGSPGVKQVPSPLRSPPTPEVQALTAAPKVPAAPRGKVQPAASAPAPAAPAPAPAPTPQVNPTTPAAPGGRVQPPAVQGEGGFDLQKAWDRTGLSNNRWKYKLPMLAAGAAGAYGLYAGAKKGFEVLGREPEPARYNAGGAIPAYGVNQYGVPDRSTSFM